MNTVIGVISPKDSFGATFPLPLLGEFSTHNADTRHEYTGHAMSGVSIGIGPAPKIMDAIIQIIAFLSWKEKKMDSAYGSTESPSTALVTTGQRSEKMWGYGGQSVSASLTQDEYLAIRKAIDELLKKVLDEFLSSFPSTELTSFDGVIATLKRSNLNESAESINELLSTDDLDPSDKPLSLESVQGFINLLNIFQDLGEPMLGRFSEGTLSVEWRIADDKHLLIEPLNGGDASFALIGPSPTRGGNRIRLNGRGKIADVVDTLRKNGVDEWPRL